MKASIFEYGSEFDWNANEAFWKQTDSSQAAFFAAQKFRSGRDAMKAVALAVKDRCSRVLLPALCCESMVSPFTMHGIEPVFYKLCPNYTADVQDVQQKLRPDTVLVYGSYFGIDPFDDEMLATLRRLYPKTLFMEDRTQDVLTPRENRGFTPDVTVASIRKWIPIADGGLLWGTVKTESQTDDTFARLRKDAMVMKSQYLRSGDARVKDCFRQLLGQASEYLDEKSQPYEMTEESRQLLERLDFEKIYTCRQANAHALQRVLDHGRAKLHYITGTPEKSTLYFPVLVDEQEKVQSALAQEGIYCPVIWPIPQQARGVCEVAEFTAEHMLGVPCDQRYTPEDMTYIGQKILEIVNE